MRKKIHLTTILFSILLGIAACNQPTQSETPNTTTLIPIATFTPTPITSTAPTNTPIAEPTAAPTNTLTPIPTCTPTPLPTCTPTPLPTSTPTPLPTCTPTPLPTCTPTPLPTCTPTPIPTCTPTPIPTCTPTPLPTCTPTPIPTCTPTPVIEDGLPEITYKENTIMEGDILTSEDEVNRYLFSKALDNYYNFGILVNDLSLLYSEETYLEIFPEFIDLKFESLTKYHNGYYLRISNLSSTQTDLALRYALRTGDVSFLSDTELMAYHKLFDLAKELQLADLNDIDAIVAVHDYLVRNTVYDTAAAKASVNSSSHYAEGLLLNNKAVCSGYASVFQLLMFFADINCEYVFTDTHAWNLVELDNTWYHIDVTWDDPVPDQQDKVSYTHFMMTDAEISALDDHKNWNCECSDSHHCDDETYRLYPYRNYLCSDESEAALLIQQQADTGYIVLVYPINSTLTEKSLLELTFDTLQFGGSISYFPAEPLGSNHYQLRINLK